MLQYWTRSLNVSKTVQLHGRRRELCRRQISIFELFYPNEPLLYENVLLYVLCPLSTLSSQRRAAQWSVEQWLKFELHFLKVVLRAECCISRAAVPTIIYQEEENICVHLSLTSWLVWGTWVSFDLSLLKPARGAMKKESCKCTRGCWSLGEVGEDVGRWLAAPCSSNGALLSRMNMDPLSQVTSSCLPILWVLPPHELQMSNVGVQTRIYYPPAAADADEWALHAVAATTSSPTELLWVPEMDEWLNNSVFFTSGAETQLFIYFARMRKF